MAGMVPKSLRDTLTESARNAELARRILVRNPPDLDLTRTRAVEALAAVRDAQVLLANAMDAITNA